MKCEVHKVLVDQRKCYNKAAVARMHIKGDIRLCKKGATP